MVFEEELQITNYQKFGMTFCYVYAIVRRKFTWNLKKVVNKSLIYYFINGNSIYYQIKVSNDIVDTCELQYAAASFEIRKRS